MTLQRVAARVRPAERLGQHRVGRLVRRCVLALVAVAAPAPGRSRRRRRAGRTRDSTPDRRAAATRGAARGARRAGLVQIGHPFITLCSERPQWPAQVTARLCIHPTGACAGRAVCRQLTAAGPLGRAAPAEHGVGSGTTCPAASWERRSGTSPAMPLGPAAERRPRRRTAGTTTGGAPRADARSSAVHRRRTRRRPRSTGARWTRTAAGPTGASLCEAN